MNRTSKALIYTAVGVGIAAATARALRNWRIARFPLSGKAVVLTGGSRGLGLVMARQLAAQGARLALIARDAEELAQAQVELEQFGALVQTYACDVTDEVAVAHVIPQVAADLGGIDVLVNNAGVIQIGPLESQDTADFRQAMDTHYWGPLYAVRTALPFLRASAEVSGSARIVNISSIGGRVAVPHLLPYSGSKFALVGLSEGLAAELAQEGIRVTTVTPGLMRTGSPRNTLVKGDAEAEYAWFKISDSLPGVSIAAEDAAAQIVEALRAGDASCTPGASARLASRLHGIAPGLVANLLGMVNRLLPDAPPDGGHGTVRGADAETPLTRSVLTRSTDRAALRNNEV